VPILNVLFPHFVSVYTWTAKRSAKYIQQQNLDSDTLKMRTVLRNLNMRFKKD
jgi:hypothetical protein